FVQLGARAVPAFGFAVATVVAGVSPDQIVVERGSIAVGRWGRIPVDDRERALVGWVAPRRLTVVPFLDLWTAVEERRAEALRTLVEDKIVLVLTEPARGVHRTPVGSVSDGEIQAQVLNAVLTGSWLREAPLGWTLGATLVIAALTAWLGLVLSWWAALVGVAVLSSGSVGALLLSPVRRMRRREAGSPTWSASFVLPTPDTWSSTTLSRSGYADGARRSGSSPVIPRCWRASTTSNGRRAPRCRFSCWASRERARSCSRARSTA